MHKFIQKVIEIDKIHPILSKLQPLFFQVGIINGKNTVDYQQDFEQYPHSISEDGNDLFRAILDKIRFINCQENQDEITKVLIGCPVHKNLINLNIGFGTKGIN